MKRPNHYWRRLPAAVRKPFVFVVGVTIVLFGLALLILPGPGWAAIFLGFAILATEFAFAKRVRDWLVAQLKKLFTFGKRIVRKIRPTKHKHK